ncbi:MAG TPA: DUF362 domain-containing protein [Candidatus Limnocylindrales bacterium]|nr:DUF362 domain-containing protein [Candidatus Limnocylindrales bacterium]
MPAPCDFSRRSFLRLGLGLAAGSPLLLTEGCGGSSNTVPPPPVQATAAAIVACQDYGTGVQAALGQAFSLLGGIATLVRGKTVTVKINLTNDGAFENLFGKPPGESYVTHGATATALASLLFQYGASLVRFVDSAGFLEPLGDTLTRAQWDVPTLLATGNVVLENTRNLGSGTAYAQLNVPGGGYLFNYFELNHCYQDTDVFISLAKLKQHLTAGITLSTKCIFGSTPNSLYGTDAVSENAVGYRGRLHGNGTAGWNNNPPPGARTDVIPTADAGWRIPRIVADVSRARPTHLAIIDGITAMSGGEGPWAANAAPTSPGVLIVGFNSIVTDAVGTAVMGFSNPQATRGTQPFSACDNHLLLAEQAGYGTADLSKIDVRGLSIAQALYPYPPL